MTTAWEEGSPDRPICFLGEAPGRTEIAGNRPLIGPAGELFNDCVHRAGLARNGSYILNVFPFMVRKSRTGDAIYAPNGQTVWTRKGLTDYGWECAKPQLTKLEASAANVVVPMGATALSALTDQAQIMKWRGSIQWSERVNKKLVATIHPAAVLHAHKTEWQYLIEWDMARAHGQIDSRDMNLTKRNLLIRPTFSDAIDFLIDILETAKVCNFDEEILNHQISCISFASEPTTAMTLPFADDGGHYFTEDQELRIWKLIAQIVQSPKIAKCNQNLVFDLSIMFQRYGIAPQGRLLDPMVLWNIMYPDFPKGLDLITSVLTDIPYYKDEGKIWNKLSWDYDQLWDYCAKDSCASLEAMQRMMVEEADAEYMQMHDFTTRMYPALIYMMSRGIKIDVSHLEQTNADISAELAQTEQAFKAEADYEFNPASAKQCMAYFYDHKGINPYKSRKTGNSTIDDTALSRIVRRYHLKEAELIQRIRNLRKLRSTYLEMQFDPDERLRCSYNPRGTRFSRLSSGQTVFGTGGNMQNLDPRFKGFLVAG